MIESREQGKNLLSTWSKISDCEDKVSSFVRRQIFFSFNSMYVLGGPAFMLKYSFVSNKWHQISAKLPPRKDFLLLPLRQSFYIYGGSSEERVYDDLWKYQSEQGWTLIASQNIGPRDNPSGTYLDTQDKLLVFGGTDPKRHVLFIDMYLFDISSNKWTAVHINGQALLPRIGFSLNSFHDRLILFGGQVPKRLTADLFELRFCGIDDVIVDEIHAKGPVPRVHHGAIILDNRYLMVYGGERGEGIILDEEWLFELQKKMWFKMENKDSLLGSRSEFSIYCNNKQLFFFGGKDLDGNCCNDLLKLEIFDIYKNNQPSQKLKGCQSLLRELGELVCPFQAFALLVDCGGLVGCSSYNIRFAILDDVERQFRRRLKFEFDGNVLTPVEFASFSRMFCSGIQPHLSSPFHDYGNCLKLGAIGLGTYFLYIEKDTQFLKVALFTTCNKHNQEMRCSWYIEGIGKEEFWIDSERSNGRQEEILAEQNKRIVQQFVRNFSDQKILVSNKKSNSISKPMHYLFVYNLRMINKRDYELKIYQNDLTCQEINVLKICKQANIPWNMSIDASLRTYLSHLYLTPPPFKITLNNHAIESSYSHQISKGLQSKQIRLISRCSEPGITQLSLFEDTCTESFWNGILVYVQNRLLLRLGPNIGSSFQTMCDFTSRKLHRHFGVVQLERSISWNLLKTDTLRQDIRQYIERKVMAALQG